MRAGPAFIFAFYSPKDFAPAAGSCQAVIPEKQKRGSDPFRRERGIRLVLKRIFYGRFFQSTATPVYDEGITRPQKM
jgi:hypothetical protein